MVNEPLKAVESDSFIVSGPEWSVEMLLGFDIEKMNREVAEVRGVPVKFVDIGIYEYQKFDQMFLGSDCHDSRGCYYNDQIFLTEYGVNKWTIYHELAHFYYGNSQEMANEIADMLTV